MIIVDNVHKRYQTDHGLGDWVLHDVTFTIPPNTNVGLVGKNGAGKSTLMRLIGGVDQPTRGSVERHCNVSWPMGFGGGLQGSLTGRQNSKFVCRINGHEEHIPERLAYIQEFAEIGDAFDEPVKTYSSGMMARLKFAISLAFDFDVYISDELTAVGDANFKKKTKETFRNLIGRAGLIMASHSEKTLKEFCTAGVWLNEGTTQWFDSIDDALAAYNESQVTRSSVFEDSSDMPLSKNQQRIEAVKAILEKGFAGEPALIDRSDLIFLKRQGRKMGITIVPKKKLKKRGYRLKENSTPIVLVKESDENEKPLGLYDLDTQCEKVQK